MPDAPATVELLTPEMAEPKMAAAAGTLHSRGARPGDRVAFWLGSSADLLCAVLGAARVGIIPVLLNANLLAGERDALVRDCAPTITVLDEDELAGLFVGPPIEMARFPLTRPMHYTSGTTGRPKGVTTGVWDEATSEEVFLDEARVWGFNEHDTNLVCSPMYHTVAVRFAAGTLLSGGRVAILSRFDAAEALRVLREVRPTTAFLVPTHLQRILALPELGATEQFDSLRLLAHAGAPCPAPLKRDAMARVAPGALWEFYGSTEGQFTVCSTDEWLAHPGTVGRARPGRRLFTEPLEDLDRDPEEGEEQVGTIWCEVPDFARFCYFNDDEATKAAWRGSAFTVGDLGTLDQDGYLYLSGRRTDLIITGGVNVYPAEVESALLELAGVDEVCVFGLDDPEWGQRVCAAVVSATGIAPDEVVRASRTVLAPFKCPKSVYLCGALPVGPTGKVLRRRIAAHLGLE